MTAQTNGKVAESKIVGMRTSELYKNYITKNGPIVNKNDKALIMAQLKLQAEKELDIVPTVKALIDFDAGKEIKQILESE